MESDLPFEVLCQVLSHVPPLERLSASLVCRRWLQAADTLLEDVQRIVFSRDVRRSIGRAEDESLLVTGRPFTRVVFRSVVIDEACLDFLNRLGPILLHLRFVDCHMHGLGKLVDCPRLQTLETNCGDVLLIFAALPHLVNLNIKEVIYLMDKTLMSFDKIAAPLLKVFAMPVSTEYDRALFLLYHPLFMDENVPDSDPPFLSHAVLEAFVARRATTLTTLHLPKDITTEHAVRLSKLDGLQLKTVSFGVAVDIPEFCSNQPSIVAISTDCSTSLSDQHVAEICELLPALLEFSVYRPNHDIDRSIEPFLRLRHLRVLRLHGRDIAPVPFSEAIPMLELRILDLGRTRIPDGQIRALLSLTPRLEELDLTGCDVSDATLAHVCPLLPQLRELVLEECKGVSDVGLRAIRNLTKLEKLILNYCRAGLTSAGIKECVRFRFLRELGLKGCPRVFKNVLKPLRAHNPCLTKLLWH